MLVKKTLVAAAVSALFMPSVWAQTADTSVQTMRQITVTGSTIDDRFGDAAREPTSIFNISGKQAEAQHVQNFIEILKAVPGVTVDTAGGDELKIKFRGVENQRYMGEKPGVAIVIDGVPVFERTGKVNVNLDNIESIKVIKGGASYLFGEDALSGAVIITTKRGGGANKGLTFELDRGADGYERNLLRYGAANDVLAGHIQASQRKADGYHFQSNYKAEALTGNLKWLMNDHSDLTFGFDREDRFRDKHGTLTGATQAELDPTGTLGRDFARNFDVNLQRYNLTYSNDISKDTNLLALAYQYKDHTLFWSSPQRFSATGAAVTATDAYTTLNDYHQNQRGFKSELRSRTGAFAYMGGLELKDNSYMNLTTAKTSYRDSPTGATTTAGKVFGDDDTSEKVQAFYGELKWSPSNDWAITGNARHDRISLNYFAKPVAGNGNKTLDLDKTFTANSLRLGAAWSGIQDMTVFGSVSTGFRIPTVDQLYRGSQSPSSSTANNPDLKPEKATNFEFGMRQALKIAGRDAQFESTVFQINRKDFILDTNGQYASGNAKNISRYENIGGARSRGLELALKSSLTDSVNIDLAYTYLDSTFTQYDKFLLALGNPRGTEVGTSAACPVANTNWNNCYKLAPYNNTGNKVPRVSPHTVNVRTSWRPAQDWKISGEIDYRSTAFADEINQERWPGRTVFNLGVDYSTKISWLGGSVVSAFARIENVFNKKYYLIARGTNDSQGMASNFQYNGKYNAEDMSITVDPGRVWRVGLSLRF